MEERDNQFKVRLSAASARFTAADQRRQSIIFDVSPELVENRNINYKTYDPVHAPGQIYVYQNTAARTFQLSNIKLISRTSEEASKNLAYLWILRSWGMPNFGQAIDYDAFAANTQADVDNKNADNQKSIREIIRTISEGNGLGFLGAPPKVLYLSAYSRFGATDGQGTGSVGHLRNIPVVMNQISIPYPTDVDYIPTAENDPTPMPTIMTVDIQLTETHSPREYETFSLQKFRTGDLSGF